ncbi:MAG: hypothetical protein ACOC4R_00030 [Bacteroidota bacterium]
MLNINHDIYKLDDLRKLSDYLSNSILNLKNVQGMALPDNSSFDEIYNIGFDRSVAQDIVRVLQGNETDYDQPGNQLVGSALALVVLDRFDFDRPFLESLRKFLDQTWTVSGFSTSLCEAMQESEHMQTILSFFRAVVAECNTSPENGFSRSDQGAVGSLVQAWKETGDIQELFSGPSAWSWYPYEHVLLSVLSLLVSKAPKRFADILDDLRFPWALAYVIASIPDHGTGNTLPVLLAHVKSCLDECTTSENCTPIWNKKLAAPLILQAVMSYASQCINQDECDGVPDHVQSFFKEITTTLLQRKDGIVLSFHFCIPTITWLDSRSSQGKISPSSLASEAFCEALRSCLVTFDLAPHFFSYGIGMADPGLDKSELQDFAETGILRTSSWKYSLAALASTAFLLPTDYLDNERSKQIIARYEQILAAGKGLFPALVDGQMPMPTHEAIAKAYLQMENPYKAWQDTAKYLGAANNRMFRLPFAESSLDIRNMELFHLCTGLAIYDHMDDDTEQDGIGFLKNMLEVVKNRLLTDIEIKQFTIIQRYLASHLAARIFLHDMDENSQINKQKSAQNLLEYMVSLPDAALEVLETLMLNGLQVDDIKDNLNLQAIVRNIYEENLWLIQSRSNVKDSGRIDELGKKIEALYVNR